MAPSDPSGAADACRRVVLVVDGGRAVAWQERTRRRVAESGVLSLAGVVAGPRTPRWRRWPWRAQRVLDRRLFGGPPDPFAPVGDRAVEAVGAAPADLVLWLAERPPGATDAGRLGAPVLWLGHGPSGDVAGPALRRAVHRGEPVVETQVRMSWPGRAGSAVLARSAGGVRPFSLWLTESAVAWKAVELLVRTAEAAPLGEPAPLAGEDHENHAPRWSAAADAAFLLRSVGRWAGVIAHRFRYRRPWRVLVRRRDAASALPARWGPGEHPVAWAPGHVYADPILFEHEGRHHLFCEDVAPGTGRGVIAHVELVAGQPAPAPATVLERPHHLSYPFVFAHGGEVFMIPETAAARRVELLRATDFPHAWASEAVLLDDVQAADATIAEHDGLLWMFVAIAAPGAGLLDELHVFWATEPRGPWTPHPRNPVVSDVRHGRPAGPLLRDGDRLVRPAQDGSRRYGWAVAFREIARLTTTEYEERPAGRLGPDAVPGAQALHTYARDSVYEAIDARCREARAPLASWLTRRRPARRSR